LAVELNAFSGKFVASHCADANRAVALSTCCCAKPSAANTAVDSFEVIEQIETSPGSASFIRRAEYVLVGVNPPIENNIAWPLKVPNGSVLWAHAFYSQQIFIINWL
jgi:hypothetical protein